MDHPHGHRRVGTPIGTPRSRRKHHGHGGSSSAPDCPASPPGQPGLGVRASSSPSGSPAQPQHGPAKTASSAGTASAVGDGSTSVAARAQRLFDSARRGQLLLKKDSAIHDDDGDYADEDYADNDSDNEVAGLLGDDGDAALGGDGAGKSANGHGGDKANGNRSSKRHRRSTSTSYAGEYEHRQRWKRRRRRCWLVIAATIGGAGLWFTNHHHHHSNIHSSTRRSPSASVRKWWHPHAIFTRGSGSATHRQRTYRNGRPDPRAFVCITGQLPRLELANKIQNLFRYWGTTHGVHFDVALVLTDTAHQSVERQGHRDQQYFDIREVYDELSALPNVRVLNADVDTQAQRPILNPHYMRQRGHDSTMNTTQLLERVQNHVRQFESLARCHHHMSAAGLGWEHYDIVHRVRDDSGYFTKVDFEHLYGITSAHPMTIASSDCEYHGGINDRGSFVSPEASYDYFNHPILAMYTKPLPVEVRNTEQYLMVTYGRTCRLIQTDSFHLFRLWDKNSTVSFSDSDIKCIIRNQIGQDSHRDVHKKTKVCHGMGDGNEYCVHLDKAGLTYFPDHVEVVELNVANARNDDDDVVWDRHTAKQVAAAGGFVVSDFDDDDDVETPRYRADHDYTEDSSDVGGLPDEGPDHDSDAEVELEDVYITLDSGDDHDKISAKKLERKKARAEKRNQNKGMLAGAAGGNEGDDEEELPEEMKFPGGERRGRLLRYLPGNSSLTQIQLEN